VGPILHEIRHALEHWLEKGEGHTIDLRSLPMAPGEEEHLLEALGEGEVCVELSILGPSEVIETRFPGVWLVTHYNANDAIMGRYIEICEIPAILKTQKEDAHDGLARLEDELSNAEHTA
jgi:hydrogenase-1 operon protein HyaF